MNTDAEGRLVLADALLVAGERHPDAIVDIATLTGGQTIALGPGLAAVLGSDEVVDRVRAAGGRGRRAGLAPTSWAPYKERLGSEVADMRNTARDRAASTIMAALFLQHFVKGIPWAHLDIAAPSHSDAMKGGSAGETRAGGPHFCSSWPPRGLRSPGRGERYMATATPAGHGRTHELDRHLRSAVGSGPGR